jgi:hypothetical protein
MLAGQEIIDAGLSPDPAQVVSGTLCLMSCALTSLLSSVLNAVPTQEAAAGNFFYIKRIADNLSQLANDLNLDPHFRRLCRHLCEHWETKLDLVDAPVTSTESQSPRSKLRAPMQTEPIIQPRADLLALALAPARTHAMTDALAASVRLH